MQKTLESASLPLPMSSAEMRARGWDECDVVLITGDAYVDHPAFGVALIGRWLEACGYRVGIIAQPDLRRPDDFRALGRPRLCWGITAGNVDSELASLTVRRRRRHDDPYSPGGQAGLRPRNATIAYTAAARHAFKNVPVVLGGIEASLRRFPYYDFWTNRVRRALLFDAKADILIYGMAERAFLELLQRLAGKQPWIGLRGTAVVLNDRAALPENAEFLPPFEEISRPDDEGRRKFMEMALQIESKHLLPAGVADFKAMRPLAQHCDGRWLTVFPPAVPLSSAEMDRLYALPFSRRPHPCYAGARIPAFDMIKHSITTHRGCYGACRFCALRVHQGAQISSRSLKNIAGEIRAVAARDDFDGTISDIGGPSVNMYASSCKRGKPCQRPAGSCVLPKTCAHLQLNYPALINLLRIAREIPRVRHVFIASGLRCDLALEEGGDAWLLELLKYGHIGGRLKIAPEHVSESVLSLMGKFSFAVYQRFTRLYYGLAASLGKKGYLAEYFMSGHPGCTLDDMRRLADYLRAARRRPEQIQDFYPAPMTLSAAMFYSGLDPVTMQPIYVPRTDREKSDQLNVLRAICAP